MLKGRLFADRFLNALETARDYGDRSRLANAADFLDAQILQERTFSYNHQADWLAPRLQVLRRELDALRASPPSSELRASPQLAQLVRDTRQLIRDMDDAERDSWGELAATNAVLDERMGAIGDQVLGIGAVFAIMSGVLGWLLFLRRSTESRLRRSASIENIILERSPVGIVVTQGGDRLAPIVHANQKFAEFSDTSPQALVGQDFYALFIGGAEESSFNLAAMNGSLQAGHAYTLEGKRRRADGEQQWYRATCQAIDTGDLGKGIIWLLDDITERKQSEETVWRQANFDGLTGLPNRRLFRDRLGQAINKAHRHGTPLAVMFLDLDRFKEVNDTLGHDAGDVLLQEAARRIGSCIRETDTVARLGGDEFTVILSELHDPDNAERVAEEILEKLTQPFTLRSESVFISASVGITLYPGDGTTVDVLIKNADQAMYAAKGAGRNRFSYFTPALQAAALLHMRLISELRQALAQDQFRVYYQPIIDLASGNVCKAEALVRWQHPTRGLVAPDEFISAAEDSGLIRAIGEWVFHEAAQQAKHWRQQRQTALQVTVNMSPVQFSDDKEPAENWPAYLRRLGMSTDNIVVEITESLLMDTGPAITGKLLEFRDAGIQVSLDDFGTGYASLSYLKHFDIDYLKIDQSFVRNLEPGSDDMALSEAIIVMAHKLGLKVIAEGVETAAQRDLLRAAGCDFAQGFLYARPLPAAEFDRLLEAESPLV
jgi:diguanylate cyclase (GGDEF)-like protein/PAS domain S-box-containing protein